MKNFGIVNAVVGCVLIASLWAGDQKNGAQAYSRPGQTADLEIKNLVTARQDCENWAIAAGLETILKRQKVSLDQNFWVLRISGGEICAPGLPSQEALAEVVNRDFVLDDGRHVRLQLHWLAGAPVDVDAVIAGLKRQELSLLILRDHPYYLMGVTYDESINSNGSRYFVITELRLANTFAHQPGLTFSKGRDNMNEIRAVINVSVTEVNP